MHRRDRVYLGRDQSVAAMWAAMHPSGRGDMYLVAPTKPIEPDPDYLGGDGLSVQVASALVLERLPALEANLRRDIRELLIARSIDQELAIVNRYERLAAKPGRNEACWCGSGDKYKRCCGR